MVSLTVNPISDLILAAGFIITVVVVARTKIPRQTIKDLQEHIAAQDLTIKDLQADRTENSKNIARLQGQLDLYKELPLRELAEGMKEIVDISKENALSNQKILEVLTKTSEINAEDRSILTKGK